MRYRKKPITIEATQWFKNGDHPNDNSEMIDYAGSSFLSEGKVVRRFNDPELTAHALCELCGHKAEVHGWIDTLEGGHRVCPGDWIITGIKGERYPCKPDIFASTYDPVPAGDERVEAGSGMTKLVCVGFNRSGVDSGEIDYGVAFARVNDLLPAAAGRLLRTLDAAKEMVKSIRTGRFNLDG